MSVLDSVCMRSCVLLIAMSAAVFYFNKSPNDVPKHLRKAVFFRSVGLSAVIGFIGVALTYIPVTIMSIIISSNPFFTAILSHFFLTDRLTTFEIVAMILSFSGVVLIAYATPDKITTSDI